MVLESKDQRNFRCVGLCGREVEDKAKKVGGLRQSHIGEDTLNARLRGAGSVILTMRNQKRVWKS